MRTPFLEDFERAGFERESINTVLCTHLHVDHVGWNTMWSGGKWVPTFPRARYLIGQQEYDYWRDQDELPDERLCFADSVQPVFDAGLMDLVETDHRICDEVSLISTPGHTPGQVSVRIVSRGAEALITGDMVRRPSQIGRPEWSCYVDTDPAQSEATRRAVFAELARGETLVIGTHFPTPTSGRIISDGASYRFVC